MYEPSADLNDVARRLDQTNECLGRIEALLERQILPAPPAVFIAEKLAWERLCVALRKHRRVTFQIDGDDPSAGTVLTNANAGTDAAELLSMVEWLS